MVNKMVSLFKKRENNLSNVFIISSSLGKSGAFRILVSKGKDGGGARLSKNRKLSPPPLFSFRVKHHY